MLDFMLVWPAPVDRALMGLPVLYPLFGHLVHAFLRLCHELYAHFIYARFACSREKIMCPYSSQLSLVALVTARFQEAKHTGV